MKIPRWLTLNLLTLVALLAVAGLSAYTVAQQASLRRDAGLARQELASLRDTLSQYEASLASDIAAARQEAADALAQSDAKHSARLDSLQGDFDSRLAAATTELSEKIAAVLGDASALKQDLSAIESQSEASDAALSAKLDQQATEVRSAQVDAQATRARLDTLSAALTSRLADLKNQSNASDAALSAKLDQQTALLRAAQADVQSAQARLETLDAALAQGLNTLESRLQQDIQDLTASVGGLQQQTATLTAQAERLLLDAPAIYTQVKNSVVQVKVTKPTGEGTGSGFLYGEDRRTIVTAHHVIRDAPTIRVVTEAGQSIFATVVGSSQEHDVAVLRLPVALYATPLQLGDSDTLKVGEPVMLVGTPLGEPGTATAGIVSALHRTEIYEDYTVRGLVQFDAATNRGNSGGPLLNARGEVVGIAVAGVVPTSGSGINFAVPSNSVAVVLASTLR